MGIFPEARLTTQYLSRRKDLENEKMGSSYRLGCLDGDRLLPLGGSMQCSGYQLQCILFGHLTSGRKRDMFGVFPESYLQGI